MSRSLYICYFGLREPLVQAEFIPYLVELDLFIVQTADFVPPNVS